jgi:hypothetical protein
LLLDKQVILNQVIRIGRSFKNIAENNAADNGIRLIMIKALATFVLATAKIKVIFEKRMNKAFITPGIPIL